MGVGIAGGYGENRGSTNTSAFYDQPTYTSREHAYKLWQDPNSIPGFFTGMEGGLGEATMPDLGTVDSIVGQLRGLGTTLTPTEREGVTAFERSTNLRDLQRAQAENFGNIVTPSIRNALAATGRGRSGAEGEAISRAGVESTVPLTQLANQRQAELGQLISGLGAGAAERYLRALLGGGQLSLTGALGASQQANSLKAQQLANRNNLFATLLNFLQPLKIRQKGQSEGSNWDVKGSAQYGISGIGGGGGSSGNLTNSLGGF